MTDLQDLNHDGTTTAAEIATYNAYVTAAKAAGLTIEQYIASLPGGGAGAAAAKKRTNSTSTQRSSSTSSDVTIYSLNQVRNVATSAFESALGRAPSQAELNTFLTTLNAYSKANPSKTTRTASNVTTGVDTSQTNTAGTRTTTTSSPTSTGSSSSTSSGGVDVAGFAASQLENSAEARAVKVDDIFRGAMGYLANQIGG